MGLPCVLQGQPPSLYLNHSILTCNFTWSIGGGIYNNNSNAVITNCAFSGNEVTRNSLSGGGLFNSQSNIILSNGIFWLNIAVSDPQIYNSGFLSATYCDIQGGWTGVGNIDEDPLFIRNPSFGDDGEWRTGDDDFGDLRLQPGSPCIDAGDNTTLTIGNISDLLGNPRFSDNPAVSDSGVGISPIVDMGAYEFYLMGDLNWDYQITMYDLNRFASRFLDGTCALSNNFCGGTDINLDGYTDLIDLSVLSNNWLNGAHQFIIPGQQNACENYQ